MTTIHDNCLNGRYTMICLASVTAYRIACAQHIRSQLGCIVTWTAYTLLYHTIVCLSSHHFVRLRFMPALNEATGPTVSHGARQGSSNAGQAPGSRRRCHKLRDHRGLLPYTGNAYRAL